MQMQPTVLRFAILFAALFVFAAFEPLDAAAKANPVEGSWRGNGRAVAKDGKSYKVRCRLRVYRTGTKNFHMSGKCTSTKGTSAGAADLKQVNSRSFRGKANGLSNTGGGSISVNVNGKRMSLNVRGSKGRLSVRLRKQGR
ncbi:MAG: hypothetical protein AAGF81_04785 [Pseudomonadota bacterium]